MLCSFSSRLRHMELAALCLVVFAPLAAFGQPSVPASGNVLAQYVLMAHSDVLDRSVPLVRAIVAQPASYCPTIALSDGSSRPMMRRANPNPAAFGVTVCEAVVELASGMTARLAGQSTDLPLPATLPIQVDSLVVVGDSGCKGGSKQICTGPKPTWPFPAITQAAAGDDPDLVIHVGDYNYRGTPSKTGAGEWSYDGCLPTDGGPLVRQATLDTWTTWNEDFFAPAAPLLAAAPWAFTRGNHELCSRAGRGFFYFLDAHSPLLNPWLEAVDCDAPTAPIEPYLLHFANIDLVMLDTANACGGEDGESAEGTAYELRQYMLQLNSVNALAEKSDHGAWLVGHRPIWSLYQSDPSSPPTSQNETMQPALAATPLGKLAPAIDMILSGHMHQFFSLTFQAGDRPAQLVIGNSGVELSGNTLPSPWQETVDGVAASGLSAASSAGVYGYLHAKVTDAGNWQGTVKAFTPAGMPVSTPVATCGLPISASHLCLGGS